MAKFTNWGKYPIIDGQAYSYHNELEAKEWIKQQSVLIARGNGRSYGDSSLQTHMFSTKELTQIKSFDPKQGLVEAEAGCTIGELLSFLVPRGFILPVIPGSKQVSLGGAIAANVHGKNHRDAGSIARWVTQIKLLTEDGNILLCTPEKHSIKFLNTLGGLGLTGIILSVQIRVKAIQTSYFDIQHIRSRTLEETMALLAVEMPYTVAWLDGMATGKHMGRGIITQGTNLNLERLPPSLKVRPLKPIPSHAISLPSWLNFRMLYRQNMTWFNTLYYHRPIPNSGRGITHINSFFFPLDTLANWNQLYGKNGFLQYQFVLPMESSPIGLPDILDTIARSDVRPYLSVLKLLGKEILPVSSLSFPMPGYTLALDFPNSPKVHQLLSRLDQLVIHYGGRLYLAKDARLPQEHFRKMYPEAFQHPSKFQSLQSQRLGI